MAVADTIFAVTCSYCWHHQFAQFDAILITFCCYLLLIIITVGSIENATLINYVPGGLRCICVGDLRQLTILVALAFVVVVVVVDCCCCCGCCLFNICNIIFNNRWGCWCVDVTVISMSFPISFLCYQSSPMASLPIIYTTISLPLINSKMDKRDGKC